MKSSARNFPCWYSNELINLINRKFVAKVMYNDLKKKGCDTTQAYATFSSLRKDVKYLQDRCHDKYVANIEGKLSSNTKCFFSYTKSLKATNSLPKIVQHDGVSSGVSTSNRQSACNLFADYFASVFQKPDSERITKHQLTTDFIVSSITNNEVKLILDKLDQYKTSSPDNLPAIFYKKLSRSICKPMAILFNKSIHERKYPTLWKMSFIIPIFKEGNRSSVKNYGPISILYTISKVFERIMFNRLYGHIREYISLSQHGFVSGRSTQTNLLEFVNFVVHSIANGGQVDTIFTDFSKAFDQVSHNLLLQDLENFGVNGAILQWFESHLNGRSQFVMIGSTKSHVINPTSGIPQGSILGPLFFLIFINSLPETFKSSFSSLFR